eukprot:3208544-Pyramimonas_sp.AAC.1
MVLTSHDAVPLARSNDKSDRQCEPDQATLQSRMLVHSHVILVWWWRRRVGRSWRNAVALASRAAT